MNTLYLGLRAYELSVAAKRQVTNPDGGKRFADTDSDEVIESKKMFFYQYMPFSSRVAHVIQAVTDKQAEEVREKIARDTGVDPSTVPEDAVKATSAKIIY